MTLSRNRHRSRSPGTVWEEQRAWWRGMGWWGTPCSGPSLGCCTQNWGSAFKNVVPKLTCESSAARKSSVAAPRVRLNWIMCCRLPTPSSDRRCHKPAAPWAQWHGPPRFPHAEVFCCPAWRGASYVPDHRLIFPRVRERFIPLSPSYFTIPGVWPQALKAVKYHCNAPRKAMQPGISETRSVEDAP